MESIEIEALLARFVAAFDRGIEGELAAVKGDAAAFDISLSRGEELGGLRYAFFAGAAAGKLAPGTTCILRAPGGEQRVVVERVTGETVAIAAALAVDVDAAPLALVVAPWFLYDRLREGLAQLSVAKHGAGIANALRMFGKLPSQRADDEAPRCDHAELDASQAAAVALCAARDLAFVWGPPGTGKTMTLAHVVEELRARGERILLVSTTNAAIDQVLAKLAARPWFAGAALRGDVIRLGRSEAETFGTEIGDVIARLDRARQDALVKLRTRIGEVVQLARFARALLEELAVAAAPQQSLFAQPSPRLRAPALARVMSPGLAEALADRDARDQRRALELRLGRLERVRVLAKARVAQLVLAGRDREAKLVAGAGLVACTLTTAYLSPLLADARFATLIAEEAGMATLPPLFHAACRCDARTIVVGDPRQLPPIVQADDDRVRRAIGRNIFEVAIPDFAAGALDERVALLAIQYRMHPAIGALVGKLFYGDRLVHRADPAATAAIAARAPFPGEAAVVVDTHGTTACERAPKGMSRINPRSAEIVAELAHAAVRAGTPSIAVITPYAAQAVEIRRLLAARRIGGVVECSTIHRFQGRECDVVIVDLVDAAPMPPSALLADTPNLVNVSISRARGKLVVVADVAHFRDGIVAALLRAIDTHHAV